MAFNFKRVFASLQTSSAESTHRVVGIDVGSSSVKVVEVEQVENVLRLSTYGELQLGPYAQKPLGSNVALSVNAQTESIVDVMRESDVKAGNAVMTLPLTESFVTNIGMTAKPEEDISPRVNVEARKHIPIPLSEVVLEWVEIDRLASTPENVRELLLVAIERNGLADVQKITSAIQKVSDAPEVEVFSTIRALTKQSDESLAIIDFGAKTSKLYITEGGYLRRIHRVSGGGAMATQKVADLLSVPFEEAENLKRNFTESVPQATEIKKAVLSTYERHMQEFKRALSQYEVRSGKPFTRLVLTGGAVGFQEFIPFANYALDRKAEKANAFTKLAYPAFMQDTLVEIAPTFSVALGAALRSFE